MTKYDLTEPKPPAIFQRAPSHLDRPASPDVQARQGLEACERVLRETLGVSLKEAIEIYAAAENRDGWAAIRFGALGKTIEGELALLIREKGSKGE